MKITGYAIREAIKQHELRRDTAARSFTGSLKKFDDEQKEPPQEVIQQYISSEKAIAQLQVAQMRYNLTVMVDVRNERITLAEAIKRIGGEARVEKMWRSATGGKKDSYYSERDEVREANQIRARAMVTPAEATKRASVAAKIAGAFRAAIATGNAVSVELDNLDPTLFE